MGYPLPISGAGGGIMESWEVDLSTTRRLRIKGETTKTPKMLPTSYVHDALFPSLPLFYSILPACHVRRAWEENAPGRGGNSGKTWLLPMLIY